MLTPQAATGIKGRNGQEFIVAQAAESLAVGVIGLLQDPAARDRLGTAARTFVMQHHRWEDELARFEAVVTGTQERPRAARSGDPVLADLSLS